LASNTKLSAAQYRCCKRRIPDGSPSSSDRAACAIERDQSFGLAMMLNFGAAGDVPIRQSSTSRPKNRALSSVIWFSQSSAARCSSVQRAAIQTIVTA
jgi:hypothetical protein